MTTLLAVIGIGVLFALYGLLGLRQPPSRCGDCDGTCHACPLPGRDGGPE